MGWMGGVKRCRIGSLRCGIVYQLWRWDIHSLIDRGRGLEMVQECVGDTYYVSTTVSLAPRLSHRRYKRHAIPLEDELRSVTRGVTLYDPLDSM